MNIRHKIGRYRVYNLNNLDKLIKKNEGKGYINIVYTIEPKNRPASRCFYVQLFGTKQPKERGIDTVGDFIKYIRLKNNLTQADLGARLGKSTSQVSDWEVGRYTPTAKILLEVIRATNFIDGSVLSLPMGVGGGAQ